MNINCKISFLVYNLNQNSLHSCQDDLNCSRCGSRCETLPRKKLKDSGNNATGHCWSLYKCHDGRWEKIFPHFFHRPKCLFHSFFTKFSKNLPFHRLHKTPKKPTYFTKNFTGETGDILFGAFPWGPNFGRNFLIKRDFSGLDQFSTLALGSQMQQKLGFYRLYR